MAKYLFPKKNSIFSISFRNYDNLGAMQRTLAWQWTLGHVTYEKVCDILEEEDTYVIADDTESRLVVIPQLVYKGKTYDPKTDSKIIASEGRLEGCYIAALNSVHILPDLDLAVDFVTRLNQVEDLWAKVEDGKELPTEEPPLRAKKSKKSKKNAEPERKQTTPTESQVDTEESEDVSPINESARPQYDLWCQLTDDNLVKYLKEMSYADRETLFKDFIDEYKPLMAEAEQFMTEYRNGMTFLANAFTDLDGKESVAALFLKELRAAQEFEDQKKTNRPQNNKEKNFFSSQRKKVNSWIKQAEEAKDDFSLEILNAMKAALDACDTEEYKKLKARYERLKSADQQTNPHQDSSGNSKGDKGTKADPSGTGSDDQSSGKDEKPAESGPAKKPKVTIAHVFDCLALYGIDEKPKMLQGEIKNLDQLVSLDYMNQWLKDLGYDNQIPPEE